WLGSAAGGDFVVLRPPSAGPAVASGHNSPLRRGPTKSAFGWRKDFGHEISCSAMDVRSLTYAVCLLLLRRWHVAGSPAFPLGCSGRWSAFRASGFENVGRRHDSRPPPPLLANGRREPEGLLGGSAAPPGPQSRNGRLWHGRQAHGVSGSSQAIRGTGQRIGCPGRARRYDPCFELLGGAA